MQLKNSG